MILNTGSRTDIPAYFSEWFYERLKEGYVCMRNPYFPTQVTRYQLNPSVVDVLVFCTKNPKPMFPKLSKLDDYGQYWFVTITPYRKEIEPHVPEKEQVLESFKELAGKVGTHRICWRYDPIFLSEKYSLEFHLAEFERMARSLSGYTKTCVISFLDLYKSTLRNLKGIGHVEPESQIRIVKEFVQIGKNYGIRIKTCAEGLEPEKFGADCGGCLTKEVLEDALGETLQIPKTTRAREACNCLLGNDIGMYHTCGHGCLYCYANYDHGIVAKNRRQHNPKSPFLVGEAHREDIVRDAKQESFKDGQLKLRFDSF